MRTPYKRETCWKCDGGAQHVCGADQSAVGRSGVEASWWRSADGGDGEDAAGERMPFFRLPSLRAMAKKLVQPSSRSGKTAAAAAATHLVTVHPPPHRVRVWKVSADQWSTPEPSDADLLTATPDADSFRSVVGHLLTIGNLCGILPAPTVVDAAPNFRWFSVPVLFSLVAVFAVAFRIVAYLYCVYLGFMTAFETVISTRMGFLILATFEFLAYIRLASRWRLFILCFLRAERRQGAVNREGAHTSRLHPSLLGNEAKTYTAAILSLAVVEIILQQTSFPLSRGLDEFNSIGEMLEDHYYSLYAHVAKALGYSPLMLLVVEFTTAATNLVLNYNDVFLIVVSLVIVRRFRVLRARIEKAAPQNQDLTYWKCARETFNDLSQLTREVDRHINAQVLLSCLNNFFSICIQLQHTVRPPAANSGMLRKIYFFFSFSFVLMRSAAVVLGASCIPEESKAMKRALYSVPTRFYNDEIHRFLNQVTTDDITLTGLGLFTITRSFMLTMLGTIVTYEILLVQMYKS